MRKEVIFRKAWLERESQLCIGNGGGGGRRVWVSKPRESLLIGEGLTSSLVPLVSYIFIILPHQVTKRRTLAT